MNHPLSAKFMKKYQSRILGLTVNPYKEGYVLHAHLPPKACELVFEEYVKIDPNAVVNIDHKAFPSIWSTETRSTKRKYSNIYKKLQDVIETEDRKLDRSQHFEDMKKKLPKSKPLKMSLVQAAKRALEYWKEGKIDGVFIPGQFEEINADLELAIKNEKNKKAKKK